MKNTIYSLLSWIVLPAILFAQGNLTPTAPPQPTMKTLEQIEPRIDLATVSGDANADIVITNSGSYYLTASLVLTNNLGIHIEASDVVVDLNGFTVSAFNHGTGVGFEIDAGYKNIYLKNGSIKGFQGGVFAGEGCTFENLAVSDCDLFGLTEHGHSVISDCHFFENGGRGMEVGSGSVVKKCVVRDNGGDGVSLGLNSKITACEIFGNGGVGISCDDNGVIEDCRVYSNQIGITGGWGVELRGCQIFASTLDGVILQNQGRISECIVHENGRVGLDFVDDCIVSDCIIYGNSLEGIRATDNAVLKGVEVYHNFTGINLGEYGLVQNCTIYKNSGDGIVSAQKTLIKDCVLYQDDTAIYSPDSIVVDGCEVYDNRFGIAVGAGSRVTDCVSYRNTMDGIKGYSGGITVEGCQAYENDVGISVPSDSRVSHCKVYDNNTAGIDAEDNAIILNNISYDNVIGIEANLGSRIDGNAIRNNSGKGLSLTSTNNFIVRNIAEFNLINYDIASITNQNMAPIISAVGAITNQNPWANLDL